MKMPVDEYLGWLEWIEESKNEVDPICRYLARLTWHVAVFAWRLTGGENSPAPDEKEFILEFRNLMDPVPEKPKEDIVKDKEREEINKNIQSKGFFVGGLGARTPGEWARVKERRAKGKSGPRIKTQKPPKSKKKKKR